MLRPSCEIQIRPPTRIWSGNFDHATYRPPLLLPSTHRGHDMTAELKFADSSGNRHLHPTSKVEDFENWRRAIYCSGIQKWFALRFISQKTTCNLAPFSPGQLIRILAPRAARCVLLRCERQTDKRENHVHIWTCEFSVHQRAGADILHVRVFVNVTISNAGKSEHIHSIVTIEDICKTVQGIVMSKTNWTPVWSARFKLQH